MKTTPFMGLTEWDQDDDDFSSAQLAANFAIIDSHNHTSTQGQQIPSAGIQTKAIVNSLIGDGAVNSTQLAVGAVGTNNIADAAVTASKLAANSVTPASVQANSLGFGQLDPTVVPLGTVALWWRPPGSTAVPGGGWEIMDGRAWNSITNAFGLSTGTIPDMRGRFAMGADVNGIVAPGLGLSGGSNVVSLAHSHTVASHSHISSPHAHPISTDGLHNHTFLGGFNLDLRPNCFASQITVFDVNGVRRTNTSNSLKIADIPLTPGANQNIAMDESGSHNHSGSTGFSQSLNTSAVAPGTDVQLGNVTITPSYTTLLYVMRVR